MIVPVLAYHRRAGGGQPLGRLDHARPPHLPPRAVAPAADMSVELQPVIRHLRLRHLQEGQARGQPSRI
jgi:hypothetical protein